MSSLCRVLVTKNSFYSDLKPPNSSSALVLGPPACKYADSFETLALSMVGLTVAGPRSRDVLQKLTSTSLATKDFSFMSSGESTSAMRLCGCHE
ncbi:hypothetical protein EMGBS4_11860 [Acidimicrobiaceae bacterium]|nr:hypothetical protein EMGBS4_11860 [Acidimicrobiaceae bacterium]